ncbi:hypothetical protein CLOBOL_00926 [Enterocloster bolteae ATCC BAA-613]|uniref:Uncharacterized protein n=1 Tax=Enterocloster bolteae (strain ATCC BAA-613 / DSM 15670 / CCUG 46953 / JCM 12243 / WAL 16351) TaxID=411902 RepID=A8RJI9_ENTBW|nr:hypothetical protein CLOBOL_00926 [Enterocloster bolteae ATCC BAA-613]
MYLNDVFYHNMVCIPDYGTNDGFFCINGILCPYSVTLCTKPDRF